MSDMLSGPWVRSSGTFTESALISRPVGEFAEEAADSADRGRARSHRWIWVTAGALTVAAGVTGAWASAGHRAVAAPVTVPAAPIPVAIRTVPPVRTGVDGALVVAVAGTRCGVRSVGPAELPQRPNGRYCLVSVVVRNAGAEPRFLDGIVQRATDTAGRTHPVADRASIFVNDRIPSILEEIPPGRTVRGVLPFDVPPGTGLIALTVHESAGSPGMRLSL